MGNKRRRQLATWLSAALVLLGLVVAFFPFLWLLMTSLKQPIDAFSLPPAGMQLHGVTGGGFGPAEPEG